MSKLPFKMRKMPHVDITLLRSVSNFADFPFKYILHAFKVFREKSGFTKEIA